ncbi:FAD-dependent monooxygenase [Mycolicibacterium sp. S2-37]|uniref:FAD-dependent oxidoreductase n=1 Tax=Mycolicibacterium sp. S2-37 TaxID=2810297 RepID=UPI001A943868|nr:NAD(P)/FAD-dependent oxidoreductase [Mycolicibacterium sp. S2-37]MBO0676962.1 FAD-dependent monooxygenase [Mycolicibacterium sp. S2-37]
MLIAESAEKQYRRAAKDDLRILVVGAGIAGVTAAQLLRRGGRHPVLVERAADGSHPGYMLALMPMVDAAIDDLGVRERYRAASVRMTRYAVRTCTGRPLRVDSMAAIMDRYGDYRGIARGALIDALTDGGCAVAFDSTVAALTDTAAGAEVSIATAGSLRQFEFDLVIVADGISSSTRALVLGGRNMQTVDTGWGGWVAWGPSVESDAELGEELWGAGFFVGTYPVLGSTGVFVGGPRADTAAGPAALAERIRGGLDVVSDRTDSALRAVTADPDPYYWSLTDCRAPAWTTRHTVLLGDAAAGFLPTAGIGAGMAMESAWVLTRMLQSADRDSLPFMLTGYEKIQRPRVEAAQHNSRQLARLMFHRSRALAVLRQCVMRMMSVKFVLKPIQRLLRDQPDPDAAADAVRRGRPVTADQIGMR